MANRQLISYGNRLAKLKEKITAQRQHLDELESHIDKLTKDQGKQ